MLTRAVIHWDTHVCCLIDHLALGALAARDALPGTDGVRDGAVGRAGRATAGEHLAKHGAVFRRSLLHHTCNDRA